MIDFPKVFPMAPVRKGGYPRVPEAQEFNRKYTDVLDKLQTAWATGSQQVLSEALISVDRRSRRQFKLHHLACCLAIIDSIR